MTEPSTPVTNLSPAPGGDFQAGGLTRGLQDSPDRYLQVLRAVTSEISRHQHPGPMLDAVLPLVAEGLGFEGGWIFLRQEPAGFFLASSYRAPPGLAADNHAGLNWSPCQCQRRLLSGEAVGSSSWRPCERLERAAARGIPGCNPAFHVTVPLFAGERVLGLMNLVATSPEPPGGLTELLDMVGRLVGLALERMWIVAEAQAARRREQDEAAELARALLNVGTVEDLARALFPFLRRVLEPDGLSLLVVDPTGTYLTLAAGWGWPEAHVGRLQLPLRRIM